jgi:hypothetical protein
MEDGAVWTALVASASAKVDVWRPQPLLLFGTLTFINGRQARSPRWTAVGAWPSLLCTPCAKKP